MVVCVEVGTRQVVVCVEVGTQQVVACMEVGTQQVVACMEVGTQDVIVPSGCRSSLTLATVMMAKSDLQWGWGE